MPSTKQCSKCKASFECKNDEGGCWCENYTLSLDALKELKAKFDNCLCPECLAEYAIINPVDPLIL
ncbi:MAG: cysteine-rich CWC family protein [Bacteroidetes bacterium]|nr:cysteine-rich CWC family protein [Bacteroidota bacterium]